MSRKRLRVDKMQCRACLADISSIAAACRHCGHLVPEDQIAEQKAFEAKAKKLRPYVAGCMVVALLAVGTCTYKAATRAPTPAEAAKAATDEAVQRQQVAEFDAEGTAIEAVKQRMKNPSSFELVGAKAMPGNTDGGAPGWIVGVTYRGTNSFGGVVTSNAIVSVSEDRSTALKVIDLK